MGQPTMESKSTEEVGLEGAVLSDQEGAVTELETVTLERGGEDPASDVPLDVIFEILKNERRRLVLGFLVDAEDTVTQGELAEHIAAIENDTSVSNLGAQQRKRVYIGLYQCHLPKMADAGAVEFNQDRGLISLGEDAGVFLEYLTYDPDPGRVSPRLYLLVSAVGGLLAATGVLLGAGGASTTVLGATVVGMALLAIVDGLDRSDGG